jgi:hypothetical protein
VHGAGAARTVIAALLRPGQMQALAQRIKQSDSWVDPELVARPFTRNVTLIKLDAGNGFPEDAFGSSSWLLARPRASGAVIVRPAEIAAS